MVAANWRSVLKDLGKHYGTDASVNAQDLLIIQQYFSSAASTNDAKHSAFAQPPRLTNTPWFQREHRVVPRDAWANTKVKSAANCTACHTQAEKGSYAEREISVPGYEGRKW
jgi:mono/diheme cytochrome c family protein